jgi:hypothetical protein
MGAMKNWGVVSGQAMRCRKGDGEKVRGGQMRGGGAAKRGERVRRARGERIHVRRHGLMKRPRQRWITREERSGMTRAGGCIGGGKEGGETATRTCDRVRVLPRIRQAEQTRLRVVELKVLIYNVLVSAPRTPGRAS